MRRKIIWYLNSTVNVKKDRKARYQKEKAEIYRQSKTYEPYQLVY